MMTDTDKIVDDAAEEGISLKEILVHAINTSKFAKTNLNKCIKHLNQLKIKT